MSMRFWVLWLITLSSISLVWAADTQKRALASAIGVAGKPTTTTPIFLFNMARENALWAGWLTHFWLIITTDFSEVYSHTPHTHTHTHTHTTHVHTRTHTTAKQSNVLEQLASCVDVMIYGMKQAEVFTLILKAVHALSKSVFCIQVSRHYLSVLLVWQFSLQSEPVIR